MKLTKKGQFWYMDFIVAIIIMSVIAVLFVKTVIGMAQTKNLLDDLMIESQEISENLISEGEYQWETNPGAAARIGLTYGNNEISRAKFSAMAAMDYPTLKQKLGTTKDVYVYLNDGTNAVRFGTESGIGHPDFESGNLDTVALVKSKVNEQIRNRRIENIIEINRLVTVNNKPAET